MKKENIMRTDPKWWVIVRNTLLILAFVDIFVACFGLVANLEYFFELHPDSVTRLLNGVFWAMGGVFVMLSTVMADFFWMLREKLQRN